MISAIFEQFIEATPVTVMVRGIMERMFEPTALNELFERHAVKQYTRELLFSDEEDGVSLNLRRVVIQFLEDRKSPNPNRLMTLNTLVSLPLAFYGSKVSTNVHLNRGSL